MFGRDQALSQQSIEFLQRKLNDLQSAYDEKSHLFNTKLGKWYFANKNIEETHKEWQEEGSQQLERIQNEKQMWEQKFEQKRKALLDLEQRFSRENSELEKKLVLL